MADQIGIVTQTKHKGWARVAIRQSVECNQCLVDPATQVCRACTSGPAVENLAANPIGARPGDVVRVHPGSVSLFKGVALLYALPIVFMLLGALALNWTGIALGWQDNAVVIVGSLMGLAVGVIMSMGLDRAGRFASDWTPTIRRVLAPCKEMGVEMCEL